MRTIAVIAGVAFIGLLVLVELPQARESTVNKAPLVGENSFTETQAKAWLEAAGYTHIGDLVLGSDGVWRASARLKGVPELVRLDYQGNISKH